ncbi:N-acetylmuramate alpha-1-phosphate uridylyltransferase MurU [Lysobacter sp. Root494]|uniref:N-acetylmuramate alpha-1-phosphate uridylyltransferase MurU n=1 Tax=Lysobacter sp. Root494 TaxID=1736549 RepID=UPI0006FB18C4|nr:nucleotidyltransferase family protein [Lysobacter sp. Root494]KQY51062.1 mannose-1-phosphate guanylyltransferase [Lysobacter sp. Root494]
MKALIFAAGLGERMRPLTNHTPKPLLVAGGKPLIVWHLEKLAAIGVRDVVINTSWLAGQFPATLGDGGRWGLRLHYSYEGPTPLETGGGMWNALPSLGDGPFLLVNGDIWTDYDFARLPREPEGLAHLVMVDRPSHATHGDFALDADGYVRAHGANPLTYSGLGVYRPQLLADWQSIVGEFETSDGKPRFRLAPILKAHMPHERVTGEHHAGRWTDVGTPERLSHLDAELTTPTP